ncbi:hypothetical protein ES703_42747 [subsurface metagenome]
MPRGEVMPGIVQVLGMVIITKTYKIAMVNGGAEEHPGCAVVDLLPAYILNPHRKACIRCGEYPDRTIPLGYIILMSHPVSGCCCYDQITVAGCRRARRGVQLTEDALLPI